MSKKGGDDGGAAQAAAAEQQRQDSIRAGTSSINSTFDGEFTPDFYNQRQQAYLDYANPQLDKQYSDAQKQLTFSLARGGNLDSSARATQESDLQRQYDTQSKSVADQALAYSNQTKNDVEGARGDLVTALNASGDATGAANNAIARADALSTPQAFSPLGQLFANFTAGLGTQAALEKASAASGGLVQPTYNTGLFSNSGAVKVS